jgi:lipopolysaccharide transport system permease protein
MKGWPTLKVSDKITIISGRQSGILDYLKLAWKYRSLSIAIAKRDLKIRYSQTFLGILWAVIQPLTGLIVFTIFFNQLVKIKIPGMPYPLFAFSGMVSWFFFSNIVCNAGVSLVESQDLIRKVYFPRILLLFAKILVGLVEFGISMVMLIVLMVILGYSTTWLVVFLPMFALMNIGVGLSIAIWLGALTIRYRDFHHIIPYLVNFSIWLTPVFYPITLLPPRYEWLMYLNPMAATIAGFRWSLAGGVVPERTYLLSFIPVAVLLVSGLAYFRRVEDEIVDYV